MGTGAMITKKGKPFIATHYDGYPSALGRCLLERGKNDYDVVECAIKHTIDFMDKSSAYYEKANRAMLKRRAKYYKTTIAKIAKDEDNHVSDIKQYGDWADWQYDIRPEGIYYRPMSYAWRSKNWWKGKWKKLTEANLAKGE